MISGLAQSLRVARGAVRIGPYWASRLVSHGVPCAAASRSPGGVMLEPYGCALTPGRDEWLLAGYSAALALDRLSGVRFSLQESGALNVRTDRFQVDVTTADELVILKEVLYDRLYHFQAPGNCVVIDIGLNVAIPALYFASVLNSPVIGYEVSPETHKVALHNISLNRQAAPIEAHNLGVGGRSRRVKMHLSPDSRGLTSMYRRPGEELAASANEFEAELIAASEVVEQVRRRYPDRQIVAKIDCEGAEYEIIDSLIESGAAEEITLLMVEWHRFADDHDPQRLARSLAGAQFTTTIHGSPTAMAGMLYAARTPMPTMGEPSAGDEAPQEAACPIG